MPVDLLPLVLLVGIGNPDWLHVGLATRIGALGCGLSAGTIGLASDLTGTVRFFPVPVAVDGPDWGRGAYLEAGLSAVRMATLSEQTPTALTAMGHLGLGYQWQIGHVVTNVSVGLPPLALPGSIFQPLFVTNAAALPRFQWQVGYAF